MLEVSSTWDGGRWGHPQLCPLLLKQWPFPLICLILCWHLVLKQGVPSLGSRTAQDTFCRLHPHSGSYWPHLLPIFCPCSPPSTLAQQGPSSYVAGPAGLAVGAQGSWQERLFLLTAGSQTRGIRGTRECQAKCPPVEQDTLPFTWAGRALKAPDGS